MSALRGVACVLASLALVAFATTCSKAPPRRNVLLITIDTLRADRVGAPNTDATRPATTPNLDRLGVRFTHASTPRAKTTPALASLMTGLYPHEHGVRDVLNPLELRFPTLAERFRAGGWRTGAIVGNYVLQARFSGLERGFEQWTEELPQTQGVPPEDVPQRLARSLTDGALAALGLEESGSHDAGPRARVAAPGEPWFVWLHYMDPHGAYEPPAEQRVFHSPSEVIPGVSGDAHAASRRFIAEYNVPAEARLADGRIDAAKVRDLYDGEVRFVDAEIGRLIERLRASGELEGTLVVVTADHGESLGEHDYWFEHGRDAYEASCRVPLIVRFPERERAQDERRAVTCSEDLSLVDVAPTLIDWAGLPGLVSPDAEPGGMRGESRLEAWRGRRMPVHPVFGEKVDRVEVSQAIQSKTVRVGDWKLVQRFAQGAPRGSSVTAAGGTLALLDEQLFDLRADSREEHALDAGSVRDAPIEELRRALARFVAADVRFAAVAAELERRREELRRVDPEAVRRVESLGY